MIQRGSTPSSARESQGPTALRHTHHASPAGGTPGRPRCRPKGPNFQTSLKPYGLTRAHPRVQKLCPPCRARWPQSLGNLRGRGGQGCSPFLTEGARVHTGWAEEKVLWFLPGQGGQDSPAPTAVSGALSRRVEQQVPKPRPDALGAALKPCPTLAEAT